MKSLRWAGDPGRSLRSGAAAGAAEGREADRTGRRHQLAAAVVVVVAAAAADVVAVVVAVAAAVVAAAAAGWGSSQTLWLLDTATWDTCKDRSEKEMYPG